MAMGVHVDLLVSRVFKLMQLGSDQETAQLIVELLLQDARSLIANQEAEERERAYARERKRRQRDRDISVTEAVTSPGQQRDKGRDISVTKAGHKVSPFDPPSKNSVSLSDPISGDPDPSKPNQREMELDGQEPALIAFPCDGKAGEFRLIESLKRTHEGAFPSLDVMAEYRKALAWLESNPSKRKTANGMPRFLFSWLERAQNGAGHRRDIAVTSPGQQRDQRPVRNFREEANDAAVQGFLGHMAKQRGRHDVG